MNLTPEQIERNREFLKDLRANEKKATNIMRDEDGSRCCLCVAFDTARRLGFAGSVDCALELPPETLSGFYGWPYRDSGVSSNPLLFHDGLSYPATSWNDGDDGAWELTHAEIADAFEETFPELREPQPE